MAGVWASVVAEHASVVVADCDGTAVDLAGVVAGGANFEARAGGAVG